MRDFNFHNFSEDLGYRLPIPIFSGPYISNKPDVQVFELTPEDKWVIIGTDGLWEGVPRKDTSSLVSDAIKTHNQQLQSNKGPNKQINPGQKIIRT